MVSYCFNLCASEPAKRGIDACREGLIITSFIKTGPADCVSQKID